MFDCHFDCTFLKVIACPAPCFRGLIFRSKFYKSECLLWTSCFFYLSMAIFPKSLFTPTSCLPLLFVGGLFLKVNACPLLSFFCMFGNQFLTVIVCPHVFQCLPLFLQCSKRSCLLLLLMFWWQLSTLDWLPLLLVFFCTHYSCPYFMFSCVYYVGKEASCYFLMPIF